VQYSVSKEGDGHVSDQKCFGHLGGATRADIPPKTHRFINLCCTMKGLDGAHVFSFAVEEVPIRMRAMYEKSAADFDVELMIAADNATGRRVKTVPIDYTGMFESLDFK
jgi:hypothetical protein